MGVLPGSVNPDCVNRKRFQSLVASVIMDCDHGESPVRFRLWQPKKLAATPNGSPEMGIHHSGDPLGRGYPAGDNPPSSSGQTQR